MNEEIYDLRELIEKLDKEGKIKVYSYSESKEIFNRINDGLPEFISEMKKRDADDLIKSREPKNWV